MKKFALIILILGLFLNVSGQDTVYVYQENGMLRINDLESVPIFMTPGSVSYRIRGSNFILKDGLTKQEYNIGSFSEIFKIDTLGFATQNLAIDYLTTILNRSVNDVALQDQTTPPVIVNFNRIAESTTLAADRAINDTFITVLDTLGAFNNRYVIIFNPTALRFSKFNVLSIGDDTLYLDDPLDFAYDSSSFVDLTSKNLAVDGSSTIQTFGLRGVSPSPIGITVDITRIIITCVTAAPVDLSTFGDISGGITNGLLLRVRDGSFLNVFNVKTNQDIAGILYDWTPHLATNPAQGQDGFVARLTFGGQNKIGVVIRLAPGEDLEFLVKDDLSSITSLEIIAEGHIVEP